MEAGIIELPVRGLVRLERGRVPGRMGAGMEATRGLRLGCARRFREVGKLEEVEWGLRAKAGASRVRLSLSAKRLTS